MSGELALIVLALAFAVVTGVNDGGALLAPGLRVPGMGLAGGLVILTASSVALPWLTAAPVAHTLARGIVEPGEGAALALALGFAVAVGVVACLTARGLPTSLTLAVIGGVAGAGWGQAASVDWRHVVWVLLIAAAAPIVGMLLAIVGAVAWPALRPRRYGATMRRSHVAAFTAQCLAYGANDGQKMLALFLVAGLAGADGRLDWWWYPTVGAAFAAGAMLGLPRMVKSVGSGILAARPVHVVTGEFAAAGAVLGSAALGAPVSMTQAVVGGLLGAGVRESYRRIRWRAVRGLVLSWVLTLPWSLVIAAALATAIQRLPG